MLFQPIKLQIFCILTITEVKIASYDHSRDNWQIKTAAFLLTKYKSQEVKILNI